MSTNTKKGARQVLRPKPSEGGSSQKGSHASSSESSDGGNRSSSARRHKGKETDRSKEHREQSCAAKGLSLTFTENGKFSATIVDPACPATEGLEVVRQLRAEQLEFEGVVPDDQASDAASEGVEDPKGGPAGPPGLVRIGDIPEGDDVLEEMPKPYPVSPWNGQWSFAKYLVLAIAVLTCFTFAHLTVESFRLGMLVRECRAGVRTPAWHEHGTSMVSSVLGKSIGSKIDWALYRTADMYAPWYNRIDLVAQGHTLRDRLCDVNSYIPWTTPCSDVYVPGPQAVLVASYVARYEKWWAESGAESWCAWFTLVAVRGLFMNHLPWWSGLPLLVVSFLPDVQLLIQALYRSVIPEGTTVWHPLTHVGRLDACTRDSYSLYTKSAGCTMLILGLVIAVVLLLRGCWVAYYRRDCLMRAMVAYARLIGAPSWWDSALIGAASIAAACDVKNTEEDARFATSKAVSLLTAKRKVLDLAREEQELPPIVGSQWDMVRLQYLVSFAVKNRVHSAEVALNFQGFHDPRSVIGFLHRRAFGSGEVATY